MTALAPIETRTAGPSEGSCPLCQGDMASGQRIALTRTDDFGHAWVHIRCLIEGSRANAIVPEPDGQSPAMSEITGNRMLAARARDLAARAPRGTLQRSTTGCRAVALGTTQTVTAARKVLDSIEADDIRIRAREILAELIEEDG